MCPFQEVSGLFLVRFSERENTSVLTLLDKDQGKNFIIKRHNRMFYIDEGPYMRSLEHLIEHYMRFSDGLPTNLRYPVKPMPKPQLPEFSTMPKSEQRLNDPNKRKASIEASPRRTQRSPSLPSDEHTNQIGAFADLIGSPTHNKNSNNNDNVNSSGSNDKTKKSPGKSLFDTMLSLRRSKKGNDSANKTSDLNENTLGKSNTLISQSSLSFTFKDGNDTLYNYPTNNTVLSTDDIKNQNSLGSTTSQNDVMSSNSIATVDMELFTQSDADPTDEDNLDKDNAIEEIYFIEAPTRQVSEASINYITMSQPYFPNAEMQLPAKTDDSNDGDNTTEHNNSIALDSSSNNNNIALPPMAQQNYYIPKTCVQLESVLGKGEFGSVHHGRMQCESLNGKLEEYPVAVKTLHDEHCKENRVEFLREASVMIKLSHHCIVKLIGISKVRISDVRSILQIE